MWTKAIFLIFIVRSMAEIFNVETSEGIRSLGYNVIYGDEDITVLTDAVDNMEHDVMKSKSQVKEIIKPLPAYDVKCLMSVDRYCSKDMIIMKRVLIQAIKDGCAACTNDEKEKAGVVIASMMAHDHVAWKLFLTRYDGLKKVERLVG